MDLFSLALRIKSEGFAEAKKHLSTIDDQGKALTSRFTNMQKAITGIASASAVVAIGGFLKKAVDEASDAEAALSELSGAVSNVGGDFQKLGAEFDAAAQRMQRFTRFSDDETTRALAKLVTISGDTAGALKNIGLAADIAAFKHTDLNSAAEIVGRTMTGNTRGLLEFGIRTKDATEGLEQLRQKMAGVAERDGATFQGRLEQIRNEFGNVLEAIGRVIIGGDTMTETMGRLRDRLADFSRAIDDNQDKIRGWIDLFFDPNKGPAAGLNRLTEALDRAGMAWYRYWNNVRGVGGGQGGGGGGGRDTPSGPATLPGVTVTAPTAGSGHSTPPPRTGTGTKVEIPKPYIDFGSIDNRAGGLGQGGLPEPMSDWSLAGMTSDQLKAFFEDWDKQVKAGSDAAIQRTEEFDRKLQEASDRIKTTITQGFGQTLGDGIYNAFAAAFNGEGLGGILAAFGKTVLAGVGQVFTQLGQTYLEYGSLMQSLSALLPNPFTAGPAGIAIGAALIAMGSALGAVAHGGGGRGTARAGAFREPSVPTTVFKFVNRDGSAANLVPLRPIHIGPVIGVNDPKAQRALADMVDKYSGRRA